MAKLKFIVINHRNPKDFAFGGWSYEHHENGGTTIWGILKRKGNRCKYQEIIRC